MAGWRLTGPDNMTQSIDRKRLRSVWGNPSERSQGEPTACGTPMLIASSDHGNGIYAAPLTPEATPMYVNMCTLPKTHIDSDNGPWKSVFPLPTSGLQGPCRVSVNMPCMECLVWKRSSKKINNTREHHCPSNPIGHRRLFCDRRSPIPVVVNQFAT